MGQALSAPLTAVSQGFADKMAENQKAAMSAQRDMQRANMEFQMKRQLSMQMAMTRERLNWQGAFYRTASSACAAAPCDHEGGH